jgi:hypothetical protein
MKFSLSHFESWMGRETELQPSTRRVYQNFARAFLRDAEHAAALVSDPERFIALAAEYDASLASSSRNVFRTAIRTFGRYLKARRGVDVPFRFGRRSEFDWSRHPLGPLLRDLEAHRVVFNRLEFIHWRDVRRSVNRGELNDRARGNRYFAPIETIQALSLWAGGGERADQAQPIVPAAPKSFAPMATRRLLRLARGA